MKREIKVLIIDSVNREIRDAITDDNNLLALMQLAVGGFIEQAQMLVNGDELYVDEEGLYKSYRTGFILDDGQPLLGNGVIVRHTPMGNSRSAKSLGADLIHRTTFFSVEEE